MTDINLLKRHILKRCIYGADLNPMAVELAKVSLWLDCFTLGAPLSFLNHHLKCGNSLIGTTVQEVEAELAAQKKGHYGDLFGGPFQGLLSATAFVEELRRLPDATIEQAERSHALYEQFEEAMAPFKAALDIWVSRYFGNKLAQEYLTLVGQNYIEEIRSGGKGLSPQYREVITKAAEISREKRFFHWDLEFPEAFVDLEKKTWKSRDKQGFDAVFGNPPYDVLATEELGYDVSQELNYYKSDAAYLKAVRGKLNLYKLFACKGMSLMTGQGSLSYIVPMTILGDDQARSVRRSLLMETGLKSVDSFPQKDDPKLRVFTEAKLATTVFVTKGRSPSNSFCVRTHPSKLIDESSERLMIGPDDIEIIDPENLAIPSCTQRDWDMIMRILKGKVTRLGKVAKLSQGEVNETTCREFLCAEDVHPLVLRGASISLYAVREASQGTPWRLNVGGFLKRKSKDSKAWDHTRLRIGLQRKAPQNNFRRLIAAPIAEGEFCFDSVSYVTQDEARMDLDLLLGIVNSKLLDWYFRIVSTNSTVNEYQFNLLPVPTVTPDKSHVGWQSISDSRQWNALTKTLIGACHQPGEISQSVAEALAEMSRHIQRIEANRVLRNRAERSRLADESQPIQDIIDAVLFRCYGLSDDDARYIEQRLKEML